MNFKIKFSIFLYISNILFLLCTGLVFQFSDQFFAFHSDVIQTAWKDVEPLPQILYLGMMRTEAAGFLASGVALAILLMIPFRKFELWSCWAMTTVGVVEYVPSFFANYHVASVTSASPPWPLMLALIISLIMALAFGLSGMREHKAYS